MTFAEMTIQSDKGSDFRLFGKIEFQQFEIQEKQLCKFDSFDKGHSD